MNPVTDHPLSLSLPQTTLSMAVAHKSVCVCMWGGLSFGEGHGPFYHLLKTPFGAISHVAQLDAAHPLLDVNVCRLEAGEKRLRLNEKKCQRYEMRSSNSVRLPPHV